MSTKFRPGVSGNPQGRPKGAINKIRADLAKEWEEIRPILVDLAKKGDVPAIRLIAERVCAPMRAVEQPTPFVLPEGMLTQRAEAVITALAEGEIAAGQAAQILQGLSAMAKIAETDELERRIKALEDAKKGTT